MLDRFVMSRAAATELISVIASRDLSISREYGLIEGENVSSLETVRALYCFVGVKTLFFVGVFVRFSTISFNKLV